MSERRLLSNFCYDETLWKDKMKILIQYNENGRVADRPDYCMFCEQPSAFPHRECEARFNLAKSVFHLSLEQTGAGEPTPIYHQCEIPATLIWS